MANIEITNNKTGSIVIWAPIYQDDVMLFAGATTHPAGTILARNDTSLKLILYVKGGAVDGNGIPVAVLRDDLTAAAAGDVAARPIIGGRLRKNDLIIAADGDSSNVDAEVLDLLRGFGIVALDTTQQMEIDNPQ